MDKELPFEVAGTYDLSEYFELKGAISGLDLEASSGFGHMFTMEPRHSSKIEGATLPFVGSRNTKIAQEGQIVLVMRSDGHRTEISQLKDGKVLSIH